MTCRRSEGMVREASEGPDAEALKEASEDPDATDTEETVLKASSRNSEDPVMDPVCIAVTDQEVTKWVTGSAAKGRQCTDSSDTRVPGAVTSLNSDIQAPGTVTDLRSDTRAHGTAISPNSDTQAPGAARDRRTTTPDPDTVTDPSSDPAENVSDRQYAVRIEPPGAGKRNTGLFLMDRYLCSRLSFMDSENTAHDLKTGSIPDRIKLRSAMRQLSEKAGASLAVVDIYDNCFP